jgi:hypothetical protein
LKERFVRRIRAFPQAQTADANPFDRLLSDCTPGGREKSKRGCANDRRTPARHSITSSARASSDRELAKLSALAALGLTAGRTATVELCAHTILRSI